MVQRATLNVLIGRYTTRDYMLYEPCYIEGETQVWRTIKKTLKSKALRQSVKRIQKYLSIICGKLWFDLLISEADVGR